MSELKTVNDIPNSLNMHLVYRQRLREAAKEWIRHLWGEVGRVMTLGARENVIPLKEVEKLNAQIDWINMFFNLEEKCDISKNEVGKIQKTQDTIKDIADRSKEDKHE